MLLTRKPEYDWLVYVESPLQLENAIDFAKSENIRSLFFIRLSGADKNDCQLLNMAMNLKIDYKILNVSRFGIRKWPQALFAVICLLYNYLLCEKIIIGDDRSIVFRGIKFFLKPSNLKFVDDGAYSFFAIKKYQCDRWKNVEWLTRFSSLKSDVIKIKYLPVEKVRIDRCEWVLVLGAPLSEERIISESDHIFILNKLFNLLNSLELGEIKYFPHRNERISKSFASFSIVDSELNVESYLYSSSCKFPGLIVSFYSSAIFNIAEKFSGAKIVYVDIRRSASMISERSNAVDAVYEVLSEMPGVEELKLEGFL